MTVLSSQTVWRKEKIDDSKRSSAEMKEQRERQERNRKTVAAEAYFPSRRKVGQESVPRKFSPIFLSLPQALLTGTSGFYSNWSSHKRETHFESGHGSRYCERGEKQLRLLTKGLHLSYSTPKMQKPSMALPRIPLHSPLI